MVVPFCATHYCFLSQGGLPRSDDDASSHDWERRDFRDLDTSEIQKETSLCSAFKTKDFQLVKV